MNNSRSTKISVGMFYQIQSDITLLIYLIFCEFFYSVFCCSFLGNISFVATLKFEKK